MDEHEHKGQVFAVNGELTCQDCQTEEQKYGNECFCSCHQPPSSRLACGKCLAFHQGANNG